MDAKTACRLIAQGEGQRVEFKESLATKKEAIKSLTAFAHADGGSVFFGVTDTGAVVGVDAGLGRNTLENLANYICTHTRPALSPSIDLLDINGHTVVVVTIPKARPGVLVDAFGKPYVRVGRTNQVMPRDEQRARLRANGEAWSEERDRPRFEVTQRSTGRLESAFRPSMKIARVSGEYVSNLEWRFRGRRFQMDWRPAVGSSLERTTISETFDLSRPPTQDDLVALNELGVEIRFHWHGKWRHELHRWPIIRNERPNKILWDIGREVIPPSCFDVDDSP